ncbi:MAG TPA: hypothetical protein VLB67_16055 [Acidimicrobiia bacterium]|nr:hypothetical protein [Acidimicrobiia bacterium]
MRGRRLALVVVIGLASCAPEEVEVAPDPALVQVAQDLCPVLWNWQLDLGGIMNAMSAASRIEPDESERLTLYRDALARARLRNQGLEEDIASLRSGPYVDRLREDIRNGLFSAHAIIDDLDRTVDTFHSDGLTGYHQVVSHIFVVFEKVIDVAKPEMADYGDPELIRAFISVPQCQHGVKDANDGRPRYVPRS